MPRKAVLPAPSAATARSAMLFLWNRIPTPLFSFGMPLPLDLYTLVACKNCFDELLWRTILVHDYIMCDHLRRRVNGNALARHMYFCGPERKWNAVMRLVP